MDILHPCMELEPTFTCEFCREALSLAVMGSDNVWPMAIEREPYLRFLSEASGPARRVNMLAGMVLDWRAKPLCAQGKEGGIPPFACKKELWDHNKGTSSKKALD